MNPTQPTDTRLKLALAKMLPANTISLAFAPELYWLNEAHHETDKVLDTELLHLCWMVEKSMSAELYINKYIETLYLECGNGRAAAHASWQQRTIALCKVKGVEIV